MMTNMARPPIRERLDWPLDGATYRRIKRLWVRHSIAEDNRDLDGLISTLTDDCVYEIVPTGQRWTGHDGARAFYRASWAPSRTSTSTWLTSSSARRASSRSPP